jgi:putative FmdB family regulatory protein
MPLYDFKCMKCGRVEEHFTKVDDKISMCECGSESNRMITTNYSIHADFASKDFITTDITGEPVRITSRRQMRNLMKEHGVTEKQAPSRSETNYRNEQRAHLNYESKKD